MPAARRPDAPANDLSPVTKPAEAPARRKLPRKALIGLAAAIVLAAGGWYGYHWFTIGRFIVSTDDAYVMPTRRRWRPRFPATFLRSALLTTPMSMLAT